MWYPSGLPEVEYGGQVDAAAAGNYRVVNLLDGSLATVPATSLRVLDKDLLSKYADLASMPALSVSTILLNLGLRYRDDDIYVRARRRDARQRVPPVRPGLLTFCLASASGA